MLIVAIPKSASTALMATMGHLHGVPGTQLFFPDRPPPEGFEVLVRYHSDIREIDVDLATKFADRGQVYKQHLPPTPNNVACLGDCKKVILLREPDAIIAAYRRARRRFLSVSMPGFHLLESEEAWLRRSRANGLYGDLSRFVETWSGPSVTNKLVVWYDDLMADPEGKIHAIEAFWGLPHTPGPVRLVQRRYSGSGYWRTGLFNLSRAFLKKARLWEPMRTMYRRTIKRRP
jgi:hypothetical protein